MSSENITNGINVVRFDTGPDAEDDFFSVQGDFSGSNSSGRISLMEEDESFRQEPKPKPDENKKLVELFEDPLWTDQVYQNRTKLLVEFLLQDDFPSEKLASIHSSRNDPVNSTTFIELYLSPTKGSSKNLNRNHNCKGCCFPSLSPRLKKTGKPCFLN